MHRRLALVNALMVASLLVPLGASAAPIPFQGGLLDGVLRTYTIIDRGFGNPYGLAVLHDYVLGTDFFPSVPLSFLNTATPYSRCVYNGESRLFNPPECISTIVPATTGIFGEGSLRDGCSFLFGDTWPLPSPVMVARGGCTFSQKWALAETDGFGGILVANDAPGSVDAIGIVADPNFEPTIAFMRITQEVGDQIRADNRVTLLPLEMSVSWTPNPQTPAPEPASLTLLGLGLAGLGARRWPQRGR